MANQHSKKHGHASKGKQSPAYESWLAMKRRCLNPKDTSYYRYGGRGIGVCERWMLFENFLEDLGERPEGTTLDRIDVNGNYEPSNCRWATVDQQVRNQRRVVMIECFGKTLTISEWARETGISRKAITDRIRSGVPVDVALTAKPTKGKRLHSIDAATKEAK